MKKKILYYIKEILLFFLIMIFVANAISIYRSSSLKKESLRISNVSLIDDSIYNIPKNKAVLLHFWATWCPVCKAEASNIQTLSKRYEVITIATQSGENDVLQRYLRQNNLNFRVVNDKEGKIANEYGVHIYPTTIIYDKNKKEIFSEVGYTSTFGLWIRMWWANF